jgi:hypothetical protein
MTEAAGNRPKQVKRRTIIKAASGIGSKQQLLRRLLLLPFLMMLRRLRLKEKRLYLILALLLLAVAIAAGVAVLLSPPDNQSSTTITEAETIILPAENQEPSTELGSAIKVSPAIIDQNLRVMKERQIPLRVTSTWRQPLRISLKFSPQRGFGARDISFSNSSWRAERQSSRTVNININSEQSIKGTVEVAAQLPKRRAAGVDVRPQLVFSLPVRINSASNNDNWFLGAPALQKGQAVVGVQNNGPAELVADGWIRISGDQDVRELPLDANDSLAPGKSGQFRAVGAWEDLPAGQYTLQAFLRSADLQQTTQRQIQIGAEQANPGPAASLAINDPGEVSNGLLSPGRPAQITIYNNGAKALSDAQLKISGVKRVVPVIAPRGQALIEVQNPEPRLDLQLFEQRQLLAQSQLAIQRANNRDWLLITPIALLALISILLIAIKKHRAEKQRQIKRSRRRRQRSRRPGDRRRRPLAAGRRVSAAQRRRSFRPRSRRRQY